MRHEGSGKVGSVWDPSTDSSGGVCCSERGPAALHRQNPGGKVGSQKGKHLKLWATPIWLQLGRHTHFLKMVFCFNAFSGVISINSSYCCIIPSDPATVCSQPLELNNDLLYKEFSLFYIIMRGDFFIFGNKVFNLIAVWVRWNWMQNKNCLFFTLGGLCCFYSYQDMSNLWENIFDFPKVTDVFLLWLLLR